MNTGLTNDGNLPSKGRNKFQFGFGRAKVCRDFPIIEYFLNGVSPVFVVGGLGYTIGRRGTFTFEIGIQVEFGPRTNQSSTVRIWLDDTWVAPGELTEV